MMSNEDSTDKIDYPRQTSEWGRNLIDVLNIQFEKIQHQFDCVNDHIKEVNSNINEQFKGLRKDLNDVQIVAQSALSLAEQNKDDIAEIRIELNNIRTEIKDSKCELKYSKYNCEELKAENKVLKDHINKLDNYSRRKNIIIRGIEESEDESNDTCVRKVREFMRTQLKLDDDTVDSIKFAGCHRLSANANRKRHNSQQFNQKRPIIVQFCNQADKATVWGAKTQISDNRVSVSENFSSDTEYKRNKLYMLYKKAKSLDKFKQKVYLVGDVLILDGKRYTVDELQNLPVELSPRQFSERVNADFHVFGGIHSVSTPFSNWYPCKLQYKGHTFKSVEQAYQYAKALYVDDVTSAEKLMYTIDPGAAKKVGSKVAGLNGTKWDTVKFAIMKDLVMKKFAGCDDMKAELLKTGEKTMVESGRDIHYACGLSIVHKDIFNKTKWSGKNKLGEILGDVRGSIRASNI